MSNFLRITYSQINDSVSHEYPKNAEYFGSAYYGTLPTFVNPNTFENLDSLCSINIPETVTDIYAYSFADCDNLEYIKFDSPKNVTYMGPGCFYNCSNLLTVGLSYLTNISELSPFIFAYASKFTDGNIPPEVNTLGENSLMHTNIKNLVAGKINNIHKDNPISYSANLESITFGTGGKYMTYNNCIIDTGNLNTIMFGCKGSVIPDSINGDDVTVISNRAFYGDWTLTTMNFPSSLDTIGDYAFTYTGLRFKSETVDSIELIELPASLKYIGKGAFYTNNNALRTFISYNPEPPEIFEDTFGPSEWGSLMKVCVPNDEIKEKYKEASYWGNLNVLTIDELNYVLVYKTTDENDISEEELLSIGNKLGLLEIPGWHTFDPIRKEGNITLQSTSEDGMVELPAELFKDIENIKSIEIPAKVKSIGDHIFENMDSLEMVDFGISRVLTIPDGAFEFNNEEGKQSSLTRVHLSQSAIVNVSINENAFKGNENLEAIYYSQGATLTLGAGAFYGCKSLKGVKLSEIISLDNNVFCECESLGLDANGNKVIQSLNNAIDIIPKYAFDGCLTLDLADLNNATIISEYAFRNCDLSSLNINKEVQLKTVGNYAFTNTHVNTDAPMVNFSSSIESIGEGAFSNIDNELKVYLPKNDKFTTVSTYLFSESNLTYINIPDNVTVIKPYSCYWTNLNHLELSAYIDEIGAYAFYMPGLQYVDSYRKALDNSPMYGLATYSDTMFSLEGKTSIDYANKPVAKPGDFCVYVAYESYMQYRECWNQYDNYIYFRESPSYIKYHGINSNGTWVNTKTGKLLTTPVQASSTGLKYNKSLEADTEFYNKAKYLETPLNANDENNWFTSYIVDEVTGNGTTYNGVTFTLYNDPSKSYIGGGLISGAYTIDKVEIFASAINPISSIGYYPGDFEHNDTPMCYVEIAENIINPNDYNANRTISKHPSLLTPNNSTVDDFDRDAHDNKDEITVEIQNRSNIYPDNQPFANTNNNPIIEITGWNLGKIKSKIDIAPYSFAGLNGKILDKLTFSYISIGKIGYNAFQGPASIEKITSNPSYPKVNPIFRLNKDNCFDSTYYTSLDSVSEDLSIDEIEPHAFEYTNAHRKLSYFKNVKSIGDFAFGTPSDNMPTMAFDPNWIFNNTEDVKVNLPNSLTYIGKGLTRCWNDVTEITIDNDAYTTYVNGVNTNTLLYKHDNSYSVIGSCSMSDISGNHNITDYMSYSFEGIFLKNRSSYNYVLDIPKCNSGDVCLHSYAFKNTIMNGISFKDYMSTEIPSNTTTHTVHFEPYCLNTTIFDNEVVSAYIPSDNSTIGYSVLHGIDIQSDSLNKTTQFAVIGHKNTYMPAGVECKSVLNENIFDAANIRNINIWKPINKIKTDFCKTETGIYSYAYKGATIEIGELGNYNDSTTNAYTAIEQYAFDCNDANLKINTNITGNIHPLAFNGTLKSIQTYGEISNDDRYEVVDGMLIDRKFTIENSADPKKVLLKTDGRISYSVKEISNGNNLSGHKPTLYDVLDLSYIYDSASSTTGHQINADHIAPYAFAHHSNKIDVLAISPNIKSIGVDYWATDGEPIDYRNAAHNHAGTFIDTNIKDIAILGNPVIALNDTYEYNGNSIVTPLFSGSNLRSLAFLGDELPKYTYSEIETNGLLDYCEQLSYVFVNADIISDLRNDKQWSNLWDTENKKIKDLYTPVFSEFLPNNTLPFTTYNEFNDFWQGFEKYTKDNVIFRYYFLNSDASKGNETLNKNYNIYNHPFSYISFTNNSSSNNYTNIFSLPFETIYKLGGDDDTNRHSVTKISNSNIIKFTGENGIFTQSIMDAMKELIPSDGDITYKKAYPHEIFIPSSCKGIAAGVFDENNSTLNGFYTGVKRIFILNADDTVDENTFWEGDPGFRLGGIREQDIIICMTDKSTKIVKKLKNTFSKYKVISAYKYVKQVSNFIYGNFTKLD